MEFELLETERLLLRKLSPEVYDYISKNYSEEEYMAHLGLKTQAELQIDKERYEKGLSAYDRTFAIFQLIKKDNDEVIGITGFVRHYPSHLRAELGYFINEDQDKNKGFMTEATIPMIDYGFEQMQLNRIEAMVGPTNIPSLKLLEKLNFKKEGILKHHYIKDGKAEDSVVYALLREEFYNS